MNEIINVKLKCIGPVHIGNGNIIKKQDYFYDRVKKRVYIIDTLLLFNYLKSKNLLSNYENFIMTKSKEASLTDFVRQNGIRSEDFQKLSFYSYNATFTDTGNRKLEDISPFIKDAYGLPYIPGSSLKGAISNAFMNVLIKQGHEKLKYIENDVLNERFIKRKTYLSKPNKTLNDKLFMKEVEGEEEKISIFSGLKVSDSKPLSTEDIILCKKTDLFPDKNISVLPIYRECLKPGTEIEFVIQRDKSVFKYPAPKMEACIRNFYIYQYNRFLSKFPETDGKGKNKIYIGGGVGFVSKTAVNSLIENDDKALRKISEILDNLDSKNKGKKVGDHLKDPQKYQVSPHTRKIASYLGKNIDMGLCEISFETISNSEQ